MLFSSIADSQDTGISRAPLSCEPWLFPPCAAPPTLPTDVTSASPDPGDTNSSAGGIAAGVIVSLVVVGIIIAIVAVVVVVVVWKVKKDRGLYDMSELCVCV